MQKKINAIVFTILIIAAVLPGCSKNEVNNASDVNKDFKISMLTNYADNIIIPAYSTLSSQIDLLNTATDAFLAAPSASTQQTVKNSFKAAYLNYEATAAASFGPAAAVQFNNYLNSFPTKVSQIESGIQSGLYTFTQPVASDSIQGFPALDYLLFSPNAVQQFTIPGADSRKAYVQAIITRMKVLTGNTLTQWTNGYRNTFINSTQTNVGSSIGYLVNQFAFELDAMKGPRVGWPLGKQSNGIVFADKCEGYYSGISASLAVANLTSLKNYYTGGNGVGLAEYLVKLGKTQLNDEVLAQFNIALNALTSIPDPMSETLGSNPALVNTAYVEIQKLLTLMKTDVASATAVQVTYMDNDGD